MINTFLLIAVLFFTFRAMAQNVEVAVDLNPAGSFTAKSDKLKGFAKKSGNGLSAEKVYVPVSSLTTDFGLRDTHLHEKLEKDKTPKIILVKGDCTGSKGQGTLQIKGINKEIEFECLDKGSVAEVKFDLKLSDFKIEKINYRDIGVNDLVKVKASIPIR